MVLGKQLRLMLLTGLLALGTLIFLEFSESPDLKSDSAHQPFHLNTTKAQNGMHSCTSEEYEVMQPVGNLPTHKFTNRGFSNFEDVIRPFVDISKLFAHWEKKKARVLEIGSGSGNFLIDAQSQYPSLNFFGSNYGGWLSKEMAATQIDETFQSAINAANKFNVSLTCRSDGSPVLPRIFVRKESFISEKYKLPVIGKFDIIVSQFALSKGKLTSDQSPLLVPQLLKFLKMGGIAICQVAPMSILQTQNSTLLSKFSFKRKNSSSSLQYNVEVYIFQVANPTPEITLLVTKCLTLVDGACHLPSVDITKWPQSKNIGLARIKNKLCEDDCDSGGSSSFQAKYMFELYKDLQSLASE